MTNTAAYNANEVAAVYMSLNRDDLLSNDEGGNKLQGDETLKNGFYGLSDPMKLRGLLQSFEYDFAQGSNKSTYKIRILNPTTELEDILLGFYEEVFPSNNSVFKSFRAASERIDEFNGVGDTKVQLLSNNERPPMPVVFLRWGYGTNSDSGLSRIHKARVNDIKYFISDSEDKTIELSMTDLFSYSKHNPAFNKRLHMARVQVSEDVDGEISLRKPSEIISQVLASYISTYPGCLPVVDLGEYTDGLNNIVYSYAAALAEGDVISQQTSILKAEGLSGTLPPRETEKLTPEIIAQIEDLLDRPLITKTSIDRGVKGTITPQILYQAFKTVFEQLGLKWEMNSVTSPDPVTGPLSPEQISDVNTPIGSSPSKSANDQVDSSTTNLTNISVNVQTELLQPQVLSQYTSLQGEGQGNNMLSFWPMAMEEQKAAPLDDDFAGDSLGTIIDIIPHGGVQMTETWVGVTDVAGCLTLVPGPPITKGCGTGTVPPEPPRASSLVFGTVVRFLESASTIRQNARPVTRSFYNDTSDRYNLQGSIDPVNPEFDNTLNFYHTPQWYGRTSLTESPTLQDQGAAGPIKVTVVNVEGMVEMNDKEFYLYEADSEGTVGSTFLLLDSLPTGDAILDLDWFNKDGNESLSQYETGGEIRIASAPLTAPTPEGNARKVRPLTTLEKHTALANNRAPIWVDAGLVNMDNYTTMSYKNDDKSLKYSFPLAKFAANVTDDLPEKQRQFNMNTGGNSSLKPVPVSIPVPTPWTYAPGGNGKVFVGTRINTQQILPLVYSVPLLDLSTAKLYPFMEWGELPNKEFQTWAKYADSTWEVVDEVLAGNKDVEQLNQIADNPPVVFLEPTLETAWWVKKCASTYPAIMQKRYDYVASSVQNILKAITPQQPPLSEHQKFVKELDKYSNAYVTMGDDGYNPHISGHLETILININRLLIGKSTKLRIMPLQVNMISEEERKRLSDKAKAMKEVTWEEGWAKKNNVILLVSPGEDIKTQYADNLIRPILSFPQTFDESTGNSVAWLDYGTPNSIVAKVEFTGDTRVLTNMQQSNYSVRQFGDVKALFDGTTTLSKNMITKVISNILADKIANLNNQSVGIDKISQLDAHMQDVTDLENLRNKLVPTTRSEEGRIREGTSDVEISADLLEMFPQLVSSYETDEQLAAVIGQNSLQDVKMLASVISNAEWLNFLFPDAEIEGKDNKLSVASIVVSEKGPQYMDTSTRILRRRIDFDSIRSRISVEEQAAKMTDVTYNFNVAMQQDAWTVDLTTLGIPEMDDPASEFFSRKVFFKFYDPRLANGQLHWLSGAYDIIGFKHRINPSQGFLTQLQLLKNPLYNIESVRDAR
jgi:hypothetical protein